MVNYQVELVDRVDSHIPSVDDLFSKMGIPDNSYISIKLIYEGTLLIHTWLLGLRRVVSSF